MNNVGSNGNLWSSSLNEDNTNNAWNLNFNSDNVDLNNNNRCNGQSVRGVVAASKILQTFIMQVNKNVLKLNLFNAFKKASLHKKNRTYVKIFKSKLEENITELRDLLLERKYKPQSSICFIVNYPKKREVFAANFRDRIIHHLYFNMTHKLFENTLIYDCYSCIKGKGTHFGIQRLKKHILSESNNYKEDCYVLKMDIKGYFMHIDRKLLIKIVNDTLGKERYHKVEKGNYDTWDDILDFDFIKYLTNEIILYDPTKNCIFKSQKCEWVGLPSSKSLFDMKEDFGLPIGNLTSQLFSNIFMNKLDQYVKRELHCKHYGRYVDDFYIVSKNKAFLHKIIPLIQKFLKEELHLDINCGKTTITNVKYGVEFLGAYIKPYRTYISNASLRRIKTKLSLIGNNPNVINSINSYLGIFKHYSSFKLRKELFSKIPNISEKGYFNKDYTKFIPYSKVYKKGSTQ